MLEIDPTANLGHKAIERRKQDHSVVKNENKMDLGRSEHAGSSGYAGRKCLARGQAVLFGAVQVERKERYERRPTERFTELTVTY